MVKVWGGETSRNITESGGFLPVFKGVVLWGLASRFKVRFLVWLHVLDILERGFHLLLHLLVLFLGSQEVV